MMTEILAIGPHKVSHASIEDPVVDALVGDSRVRVLYVDPPWGDGNMKYWCTLNKKHTGAEYSPLTFSALLARIIELAKRYVDGYVFIENGPRWEVMIIDGLQRAGFYNVGKFDTKYAGKQKLRCPVMYATTDSRLSLKGDFSQLSGAALPREVLKTVGTPQGLVLDPCCGMGYTARAAIDAGMHFRGNEFNAKRLSKTIKILEKSV